jgi:hypothetical protein
VKMHTRSGIVLAFDGVTQSDCEPVVNYLTSGQLVVQVQAVTEEMISRYVEAARGKGFRKNVIRTKQGAYRTLSTEEVSAIVGTDIPIVGGVLPSCCADILTCDMSFEGVSPCVHKTDYLGSCLHGGLWREFRLRTPDEGCTILHGGQHYDYGKEYPIEW